VIAGIRKQFNCPLFGGKEKSQKRAAARDAATTATTKQKHTAYTHPLSKN